MSALPRKHWTVDEYLAFERDSEEKHEFIGGDVYFVTGASENHNLIVANTIVALGALLRKRPCKLYPSDMLVHIPLVDDYHYPDITVVCGDAHVIHVQRDILLNPTLIIEVLLPSTEPYDRGRKFENYRTLHSLQEYLLVAQDRAVRTAGTGHVALFRGQRVGRHTGTAFHPLSAGAGRCLRQGDV